MNKFAIIDYRTESDIIGNLEKLGFSVIKSFKNENVYKSIEGHVDISLFFSGDIETKKISKNLSFIENDGQAEVRNRFFVSSKESYQYYKKVFNDKNINIPLYCGQNELKKKYPDDVLYNACFTGDSLICNIEYIDSSIKTLLSEYEYINVKQGYTNCSVLCIDKNNFITSDCGIYKALEKKGKNVIKIDPGYIELDGLNYGFIGGVYGIYGDTIYFTGNIDKHINSREIKNFIESCGKNIINLSQNKLYDYGGMYLFD